MPPQSISLLQKAIKTERDAAKAFEAWIEASNKANAALYAYAQNEAVPESKDVAQTMQAASEILSDTAGPVRVYQNGVNRYRSGLDALLKQEESVQTVVKDRDILAKRLNKTTGKRQHVFGADDELDMKVEDAQRELTACEGALVQEHIELQITKRNVVKDGLVAKLKGLGELGVGFEDAATQTIEQVNTIPAIEDIIEAQQAAEEQQAAALAPQLPSPAPQPYNSATHPQEYAHFAQAGVPPQARGSPYAQASPYGQYPQGPQYGQYGQYPQPQYGQYPQGPHDQYPQGPQYGQYGQYPQGPQYGQNFSYTQSVPPTQPHPAQSYPDGLRSPPSDLPYASSLLSPESRYPALPGPDPAVAQTPTQPFSSGGGSNRLSSVARTRGPSVDGAAPGTALLPVPEDPTSPTSPTTPAEEFVDAPETAYAADGADLSGTLSLPGDLPRDASAADPKDGAPLAPKDSKENVPSVPADAKENGSPNDADSKENVPPDHSSLSPTAPPVPEKHVFEDGFSSPARSAGINAAAKAVNISGTLDQLTQGRPATPPQPSATLSAEQQPLALPATATPRTTLSSGAHLTPSVTLTPAAASPAAPHHQSLSPAYPPQPVSYAHPSQPASPAYPQQPLSSPQPLSPTYPNLDEIYKSSSGTGTPKNGKILDKAKSLFRRSKPDLGVAYIADGVPELSPGISRAAYQRATNTYLTKQTYNNIAGSIAPTLLNEAQAESSRRHPTDAASSQGYKPPPIASTLDHFKYSASDSAPPSASAQSASTRPASTRSSSPPTPDRAERTERADTVKRFFTDTFALSRQNSKAAEKDEDDDDNADHKAVSRQPSRPDLTKDKDFRGLNVKESHYDAALAAISSLGVVPKGTPGAKKTNATPRDVSVLPARTRTAASVSKDDPASKLSAYERLKDPNWAPSAPSVANEESRTDDAPADSKAVDAPGSTPAKSKKKKTKKKAPPVPPVQPPPEPPKQVSEPAEEPEVDLESEPEPPKPAATKYASKPRSQPPQPQTIQYRQRVSFSDKDRVKTFVDERPVEDMGDVDDAALSDSSLNYDEWAASPRRPQAASQRRTVPISLLDDESDSDVVDLTSARPAKSKQYKYVDEVDEELEEPPVHPAFISKKHSQPSGKRRIRRVYVVEESDTDPSEAEVTHAPVRARASRSARTYTEPARIPKKPSRTLYRDSPGVVVENKPPRRAPAPARPAARPAFLDKKVAAEVARNNKEAAAINPTASYTAAIAKNLGFSPIPTRRSVNDKVAKQREALYSRSREASADSYESPPTPRASSRSASPAPSSQSRRNPARKSTKSYDDSSDEGKQGVSSVMAAFNQFNFGHADDSE